MGLPGFKERENRPTSQCRKSQSHIIRTACAAENTAAATCEKYNVPLEGSKHKMMGA